MGTASAAAKTCGSKGFCKKAGVKVRSGSVRTISLKDLGEANSLVAYVAHIDATSGSEDPLIPGCMVAVRGTYPGTSNQKRNMMTSLVDLKWGQSSCPDCKVHEGYQEIWHALMPAVTLALKSTNCLTSVPLYITGHSLGGAVATIGMFAMKTSGWKVQPGYTFHNPMSGNQAFVNRLNTLVGGSPDAVALTRITHLKDNVPFWPQSQDPNFQMTFPEIHYYGSEVGSHDYEVCTGSSDCGFMKYDPAMLCKQSECDDHLINPLAPDHNIAIFANPTATCTMGKGTVSATTLPMHNKPSQDQYNWMAAKVPVPESKCNNGWQLAPDCVQDFTYYGAQMSGCTNKNSVLTGTMWCSLVKYYREPMWNTCIPCGEGDADDKVANAWANQPGTSNNIWRDWR
jgi:hypothetical protein